MKHKIQERDSLHSEAKKLIQAYPRGTTGLLQRHLSIGYSRASMILDVLAEENYISIKNGNYELKDGGKRKDVLITFFLLFALGIVGYLVFHKPLSDSIDNLQENTNSSSGCNRTEMYSMPPEFSRAISIIEQRTADPTFMGDFKNCLNIQYKDLQAEGLNAEGVFLFDDSISSPNNLVMYVDSSYKEYDDYLTAILLVHEITHAMQFYRGTDKSCVEKEVSAFYNELVLYVKLNSEERKSIDARIYSQTSELSEPVKNVSNLLDIGLVASNGCNGNAECILGNYKTLLREMITESPFYQKQCNL